MARSSRHRGTVKILTLYCGHTTRRVGQPWSDGTPWPDGVPCPHGCPDGDGGTLQTVLRWVDTDRPRPRRR